VSSVWVRFDYITSSIAVLIYLACLCFSGVFREIWIITTCWVMSAHQ